MGTSPCELHTVPPLMSSAVLPEFQGHSLLYCCPIRGAVFRRKALELPGAVPTHSQEAGPYSSHVA
jgi:hypothetical protein